MASNPAQQKIIIYDAHCIICNSSVQFIAKNDKSNMLYFTYPETKTGKKYAQMLPDDLTPDMTVAFVSGSEVFVMSDAVIEIARHLKFPYNLIKGLRVVPKSWRDALYKFVAKNRFRFYKRRQSCILPSPALREKVID